MAVRQTIDQTNVGGVNTGHIKCAKSEEEDEEMFESFWADDEEVDKCYVIFILISFNISYGPNQNHQ